MSIQDIGDDLEAIADDLRQVGVEPGDDAFEPIGQIIERIRVQALKCRNPRGDYIDYEHDNGTDKITLCGVPIRGITKVTWVKSVRGRPVVHLEATVRARIHDDVRTR
jgi:hypothetical protein